MASSNCLACGAKLVFKNNKESSCSNPNCPGGGRYVKCGFCKEFSFAIRYTSQMACVNRRCRMYNRIRAICPACKKASLIDYNGRNICINRNCPSNAHVIDTCFFCGNKSFLKDDNLNVCTKGDCPFLLYEVRDCDFCHERTWLVHAKSCQNRNCEYFNIPVDLCERCSQKMVVADSNAPGGRKCVNPQCEQFAAVDMAEMTLDSIDISQLKDESGPPAAEPAPPAPAPAPAPPPAPEPAPPPAPEPEPAAPPAPEPEPVPAMGEATIDGYEEPPTPAPPGPVPDVLPDDEVPVMDAPPPAEPQTEELPGRGDAGKKDRQTVAFKREEDEGDIPAPHADFDEDEDIVIEDAPPQAGLDLQVEDASEGDDFFVEDRGGDLLDDGPEEEEVFVHQGGPSDPDIQKPPEPEPEPEPEPDFSSDLPSSEPSAALSDAMEDSFSAQEPGQDDEPLAADSGGGGFLDDEPAPDEPDEPEKESDFGGFSGSLVEDEEEDDVVVAGTGASPFAQAAASPGPSPPSGGPAAPRPTGPAQTPFDQSSPLTRIFHFLNEYVLKDERGMNYPLFLIIGLAGSGKTNYLTVLGDLLNKRELNYHFPYEGIDIKPVRVEKILQQNPEKFRAQFGASFEREIKTQIQDLVYTYSNRQFSEFIANTVWPPFTPPEEGSTYFLLTEITRKQRTIAKIATLETSGETFEEIIRGMSGGRLDLATDSPLQQVVHELLDVAEGYVILIDPAKKDNDDIYQNLFLALKQGVEPRAMNLFYKKVRERIMEKRGQRHGGVMDMIEGYMEAEKDKKKLTEAIKAKGMELQNNLGPIAERLKSEDLDLKEFYAEHSDDLGQLQEILKSRFPDVYEKVSKKMQERESKEGLKPSMFRDYLLNMISFALNIKNLKEIAKFLYAEDLRTAESEALASQESREEKEEIARSVMQQMGVRLDVEIDEHLPDTREVLRFKNLKHLAMAVTKTDMYPIIYPPEEFPKKKLPLCRRRLEELHNLLVILGGGTRYYNTSATGYSILRDTMYMPGHKNTLTPINVIEPIFDMLDI